MFENIIGFFKRLGKNKQESSSDAAKERLHLVLAQDRANISADFLEMMKQEIIEVIKKYIDIDEEAIDVKMTNKAGEDGTIGAPALFANIQIITIKNEARKLEGSLKTEEDTKKEEPLKKEDSNVENKEGNQTEESEEPKIEPETTEVKEVEQILEDEKDKKQETEAQKENNSFNKEQKENEKEAKDEKENS